MMAWVDPTNGIDPIPGGVSGVPPSDSVVSLFVGINDPEFPYKTLQQAIDAVWCALYLNYTTGSNAQGIVYVLPGLYGPHGPNISSNDILPIKIRDRVHIQGLGTRTCIVRGKGVATTPVVLPRVPQSGSGPCSAATMPLREVLFDCRYVTDKAPFPSLTGTFFAPWTIAGQDTDTTERIDGLTFQGGGDFGAPPTGGGGGVQLLFTNFVGMNGAELNAHVSNCVFDMRHNWSPPGGSPIAGPDVAILLQKAYDAPAGWAGYWDQRVLIANNTFVLAEYSQQFRFARDSAVAIMDVTEPCGLISGFVDPLTLAPPAVAQLAHRGVGNAVVINNLFRTEQNPVGIQIRHMALLGIDDADLHATAMPPPFSTPPVFFASNAFAPERVGTLAIPGTPANSNWTYQSVAVASVVVPAGVGGVIVNHAGVPLPPVPTPPVLPPAVTLWDGFSTASGEFDPRFVGELLSTHPAGYNPPGTPARDWRLLPDSPLIDKALSPNGGDLIVGMNNVVYAESSCDKVMTFDWDGEEYGNPRRVGAAIDIGFDEFHQMIMCGSYANDSNSHGSLNPSAPHLNASAGQGTTTRVILLPPQAAGHQMRLFGVLQQIPAPPRPIAAWTRPKGTLAIPYVDPNRPPDYRRRYINDGHPGCSPTGTLTWPYRVVSQLPVTPFVWSQPLGAPAQVLPPGQGSSQVLVVVQLDNDGLAPNTVCTTPILEAYFSTQAEIVLGAPFDEARWTNLQVEYR